MIFARNVMLCAQFAVQRAFNYAPVSSIGRFGIVLADKTLKLSGVSVCVCTSPKNSCYCFCINKSLLLGGVHSTVKEGTLMGGKRWLTRLKLVSLVICASPK